MSGISARIGNVAIGVQASKGTPAATPEKRFFLAGAGSLAPLKERARLAMTDSGRDLGAGFTSRLGVEGEVPIYLHPSGAASLFKWALGSNADGGADPNYTHTATPADDLPWLTVWRNVGDQILEKFTDCKLNTLRIEGAAGQALAVTLGIVGISYEFLASDPVLAALADQPYLFPEAAGLIQLDAAAQAMHQVSFEINNNLSVYQADDYKPADIDPGGREVGLSFAQRFTGATAGVDYREFYYASDVGTTMDPAVGTHAFEVIWRRNVNLEVEIALPEVTYAAIPVNADPAGDPIEVEVACAVEKPAAADIVTVTTKDQTATA